MDLTTEQKNEMIRGEAEERKTHYRAMIDHYTQEIARAQAVIDTATSERASAETHLAVLEEEYPTEAAE